MIRSNLCRSFSVSDCKLSRQSQCYRRCQSNPRRGSKPAITACTIPVAQIKVSTIDEKPAKAENQSSQVRLVERASSALAGGFMSLIVETTVQRLRNTGSARSRAEVSMRPTSAAISRFERRSQRPTLPICHHTSWSTSPCKSGGSVWS